MARGRSLHQYADLWCACRNTRTRNCSSMYERVFVYSIQLSEIQSMVSYHAPVTTGTDPSARSAALPATMLSENQEVNALIALLVTSWVIGVILHQFASVSDLIQKHWFTSQLTLIKFAAAACTPPLIRPDNGKMGCSDGANFNSICSFTCDEGYYMLSPGGDAVSANRWESLCRADGTWTEVEPTCEPIYCLPDQTCEWLNFTITANIVPKYLLPTVHHDMETYPARMATTIDQHVLLHATLVTNFRNLGRLRTV